MGIRYFPLIALIWLLTLLVWCDARHVLVRRERSLWTFGTMIYQMTGRFPLDFNGYGNFCGYGGAGEPVDAIDRCCYNHDNCYNTAYIACDTNTTMVILAEPYEYTIENGTVLCSQNSSHCGLITCECDAVVSTCFRDNLESYDSGKKKEFFHLF